MSAGAELVALDGADQRVAAVEQRVAEFTAQAEAIDVRNEAEANTATEILARLAKQKRDAEAERKELVGPLNATVKRINARFKDATAPLEAADRIVRGKVDAYAAEQDRIRREEEARLEAERQERERKAREQRERQEAEARAEREKAEREAAEAAELAADDDDLEQLRDEAQDALAQAKLAEAAVESLPEPELPSQVVPTPAPLKSESGSIARRKRWQATVTDPAAVPRQYLVVDEKAIRQAVRDGVREIPGVTIEQVSELAVRAG